MLVASEAEFSQRLRQLREAVSLSQTELAERAGYTRQHISSLEKGINQPSWDTVRRLARALSVSVAAFDAEPEEPPVDPDEPEPPRGRPGKKK